MKSDKRAEFAGRSFNNPAASGTATAHGQQLDADIIRSRIPARLGEALEVIELFESLPSTNEYLLRICRGESAVGCRICLADEQTSGRGRRGRTWVSPPGANLYLSLSWHTKRRDCGMPALTLTLAFALAEALTVMGVPAIQIKWPNDLVYGQRKLAGILVEAVCSPRITHLVIGLGLNVNMPPHAAADIGQPWVDLKSMMADCPDRNSLAAAAIGAFMDTMRLSDNGEDPRLQERWMKWGAHQNQIVELVTPQGSHVGRIAGINDHGQLLFEIAGTMRAFSDGEASLGAKP